MRAYLSGLLAMATVAGCGNAMNNPGSDMTVSNDLIVVSRPDMTAANDLTVGSQPDMAASAVSCATVLGCPLACSNQNCINGCRDMITTTNGKTKFDALIACGNSACPSTTGGPCAVSTSTGCQACWNTALSTNGACSSEAMTCQNDA